MTDEEKALSLAVDNCSLDDWVDLMAAALRAERSRTREECCAAMCDMCRDGWPYLDSGHHKAPGSVLRWKCLAAPMRALD